MQGLGKVKARSRKSKGKVNERSRQRKHNCNYNLMGFDTIEIYKIQALVAEIFTK